LEQPVSYIRFHTVVSSDISKAIVLRKLIKRSLRRLRQNALEKLYRATCRNWHLLDTVPLHGISTSTLNRDVSFFGDAQIHDPRGAARIWPEDARSMRHHLEPQVIPRPYTLQLSNVLISNFTVAEADDFEHVPIEVFPETMRSREHIHFMDKSKPLRRSLVQQNLHKDFDYECGYLFGSIGWQNYYHTIVDHAVRYAEFSVAGRIPNNASIILPTTPNSYQSAVLDLLNISPDKRVCADQKCIKLKYLLVPSMRRHGRAVTRAGIEAFRSQARRGISLNSRHSPRFIYLSREDAATRRILNEPDVESLLRAYGFESLRTENMSVPEQVEVFSSAEIIAGPHGAGLTNAIFADAPHIIEFLPADLWDLGYYVGLATSCGGSYDGIVCKGESRDDDMIVDLSILDDILANRKPRARSAL